MPKSSIGGKSGRERYPAKSKSGRTMTMEIIHSNPRKVGTNIGVSDYSSRVLGDNGTRTRDQVNRKKKQSMRRDQRINPYSGR